MGQKFPIQPAIAIKERDFDVGETRLMEMQVMMISSKDTHLDVEERIVERNVETAVQLYTGNIGCHPKVQIARIGIMFKGESRDCAEATRKVTFMTVQPVGQFSASTE